MPISYTVNPNGTFAWFTATGVLELTDLEAVIHAIAPDDRLVPGFRQLFDFTDISSSKLTEESLHKIINLARKNPKVTRDTKLAIVVSSDSSFQNARRYEKIAQDTYEDVIVFNSINTAKIWLGVGGNGSTW